RIFAVSLGRSRNGLPKSAHLTSCATSRPESRGSRGPPHDETLAAEVCDHLSCDRPGCGHLGRSPQLADGRPDRVRSSAAMACIVPTSRRCLRDQLRFGQVSALRSVLGSPILPSGTSWRKTASEPSGASRATL